MIGDPIGDAVNRLRARGLVAYPTETVWGLGADATSEAAVAALRRWKGRAAGAPLSILVSDVADLAALGFAGGDAALKLAAAFWPGPLTLVMACPRGFAAGIANPQGGVGVRCSSHPLAGALARRCRAEGVGPITATSLNHSGEPPARMRSEADALCGFDPSGPARLAVEAAEAGGDRETTVVDLSGDRPRVLRWGALVASDLEAVLPDLVDA